MEQQPYILSNPPAQQYYYPPATTNPLPQVLNAIDYSKIFASAAQAAPQVVIQAVGASTENCLPAVVFPDVAAAVSHQPISSLPQAVPSVLELLPSSAVPAKKSKQTACVSSPTATSSLSTSPATPLPTTSSTTNASVSTPPTKTTSTTSATSSTSRAPPSTSTNSTKTCQTMRATSLPSTPLQVQPNNALKQSTSSVPIQVPVLHAAFRNVRMWPQPWRLFLGIVSPQPNQVKDFVADCCFDLSMFELPMLGLTLFQLLFHFEDERVDRPAFAKQISDDWCLQSKDTAEIACELRCRNKCVVTFFTSKDVLIFAQTLHSVLPFLIDVNEGFIAYIFEFCHFFVTLRKPASHLYFLKKLIKGRHVYNTTCIRKDLWHFSKNNLLYRTSTKPLLRIHHHYFLCALSLQMILNTSQ